MSWNAWAQARTIDERSAVRVICSSGPAVELRGAAHSRTRAAEALGSVYENPRLRAEHQRVLSGPDDQETIIGLGFSLPVSGRRVLLRQAAKERDRQFRAQTATELLDAALELRALYARAVLDTERVGVLRAQQLALVALRDQTARLARAGEVAEYDQLRQQAEVDLHAQRLASAEAAAEQAAAALEVWLGDGMRPKPQSVWELAGARQIQGSAREARAERVSPAVAALEAQARASALEARSARRRAVPEPELFGGYRATSSADLDTGHGIALAIEVPLPVFDHGQAEAARAEADASASRALASVQRRSDRARQRAAARKLGRLESLAAEVDRSAAQAARVETKALALYRAGEAGLSELLDALRSAEATRLGRIELAEELVSARLELMRASGGQFDPALDRACTGDAP